MERADRRRIGPWAVHEQIGKGGNARVYRAERDGQVPIALKVLDRQRLGGERYSAVSVWATLRQLSLCARLTGGKTN
jgi:hypothetical protein